MGNGKKNNIKVTTQQNNGPMKSGIPNQSENRNNIKPIKNITPINDAIYNNNKYTITPNNDAIIIINTINITHILQTIVEMIMNFLD